MASVTSGDVAGTDRGVVARRLRAAVLGPRAARAIFSRTWHPRASPLYGRRGPFAF